MQVPVFLGSHESGIHPTCDSVARCERDRMRPLDGVHASLIRLHTRYVISSHTCMRPSIHNTNFCLIACGAFPNATIGAVAWPVRPTMLSIHRAHRRVGRLIVVPSLVLRITATNINIPSSLVSICSNQRAGPGVGMLS